MVLMLMRKLVELVLTTKVAASTTMGATTIALIGTRLRVKSVFMVLWLPMDLLHRIDLDKEEKTDDRQTTSGHESSLLLLLLLLLFSSFFSYVDDRSVIANH